MRSYDPNPFEHCPTDPYDGVLPPNDYNMAFVLSQPIFSGRRLLKARKQADVGVDVAGKSYVTTVQDTLLGVTRAYYAVRAIQENIAITRPAVDEAQETLPTAEAPDPSGETVAAAVPRAWRPVPELRPPSPGTSRPSGGGTGQPG